MSWAEVHHARSAGLVMRTVYAHVRRGQPLPVESRFSEVLRASM